MPVPPDLLEVREYTNPGYAPVVDFDTWRVAILNYIDELRPENLTTLQRHNETDEVFVLLRGRCILFIGEDAGAIHAEDLVPLKMYNVKRSVWHTHTLREDAMVIIVENRDTVAANSPKIPLSPKQRQRVVELTREMWG